MAGTGKLTSRFERVREILRDAAHNNENAFGGLHLWEFTRDQLLTAELRGIPLIAPEKEVKSSCCQSGFCCWCCAWARRSFGIDQRFAWTAAV